MTNATWMSRVHNDTCIANLAIPGTHDSGAYHWTIKPMTRAQKLSIGDQLEAGVRAFDIRCALSYGSIGAELGLGLTKTKVENAASYNIFRGPFDQGISVRSVLEVMREFLRINPSEALFLLFKQENGSVDISAEINRIVQDTLGVRLYQMQGKKGVWPSLNECRGRAVVFSNLQTPLDFMYSTCDWPDNPEEDKLHKIQNKHFQVDARTITVQDLYKAPQVEDKKKAVVSLLTKAANDQEKLNLYFNFTNFVCKPWEPIWSSETHMTPFLREQKKGGGFIFTDDMAEELATHIINWNL